MFFHRGPQGGHLGSQICASEWTVMREWPSLRGGKRVVLFLAGWKAVPSVRGPCPRQGVADRHWRPLADLILPGPWVGLGGCRMNLRLGQVRGSKVKI